MNSLRKFVTPRKFLLGLLLVLVIFLNRKAIRIPAVSLKDVRDPNMLTIIEDELKAAGYSQRQADHWKAVALHETNGFKSGIYRENLNAFGMKHPRIRRTFSIGENRGHALFASRTGSARDLVEYLRHFNYPKQGFETLKDHVRFMKSKGYFTDSEPRYLAGVRNWAKVLNL